MPDLKNKFQPGSFLDFFKGPKQKKNPAMSLAMHACTSSVASRSGRGTVSPLLHEPVGVISTDPAGTFISGHLSGCFVP
jgi:hypothetical protein